MASPLDDIARAVASAESFLVCSHTSPDGDAIGSLAAMGHLLAGLGKTFALYDASGLPPQFSWVNLPGPVLSELPARECRLADGPGLRRRAPRRARHAGGHGRAPPPWSSTTTWPTPCGAPSTGWSRPAPPRARWWPCWPRPWGSPLSGPLGEAVYLSLVTDTGNFTHNNTTPQALRLAAEIVELGLKPGRINPLIQNQWSQNRIKLFGEVLGEVTLHFGGQLGVIRITLEQFVPVGGHGGRLRRP